MMTTIIFYEKPGCANNARQKRILRDAGYELETRDLLTHRWKQAELRDFFHDRAITEWFNPASPRIKSGEINPNETNETQALELMVNDPILIRRPLIEYKGKRLAGFDAEQLRAQLEIEIELNEDVTTCVAKKK